MIYRGHVIEFLNPPIPSHCGADFAFWPEWDEEETATASSEQDARGQIDEKIDNCEHKNMDHQICGRCAGSGEGMFDGSTCGTCHGGGTNGHICLDCGYRDGWEDL